MRGAHQRTSRNAPRPPLPQPGVVGQQLLHLGAEAGVVTAGGVQQRLPLVRAAGRTAWWNSVSRRSLMGLLSHRCPSSGSVGRHGPAAGQPRAPRASALDPGRYFSSFNSTLPASQARAKRQSRVTVLTDRPTRGGLLHAQARVVAQQDDLRHGAAFRPGAARIASSSASRSSAGGSIRARPSARLDAAGAAAALAAVLAARLLDQDLAHGPGGGPEEVSASRPAGILVLYQSQIGLMDQGRRLKSLAWPQPGRPRRGQVAQLGVELRKQLGGRLVRAVAHVLIWIGHRNPPAPRAGAASKRYGGGPN